MTIPSLSDNFSWASPPSSPSWLDAMATEGASLEEFSWELNDQAFSEQKIVQDFESFVSKVLGEVLTGICLTAQGVQINLSKELSSGLLQTIKPYLLLDRSSSEKLIMPYYLLPIFCSRFITADPQAKWHAENIKLYCKQYFPEAAEQIKPSIFKLDKTISMDKLKDFLKAFQDKEWPLFVWYIENGFIGIDDIIQEGNVRALGYLIPRKPEERAWILAKIEQNMSSLKKRRLETFLQERGEEQPEIFCKAGITHYQAFILKKDLQSIFAPEAIVWQVANNGVQVEDSLAQFLSAKFSAQFQVCMQPTGLMLRFPDTLGAYLSSQLAQHGIIEQLYKDAIVIPPENIAKFFQLSGFYHAEYDLAYQLIVQAHGLTVVDKRQLLLRIGYEALVEPYINILNAELCPNPEYQERIEKIFTQTFQGQAIIQLKAQGLVLNLTHDIYWSVYDKLTRVNLKIDWLESQKIASTSETTRPLLISVEQMRTLFRSRSAEELLRKYIFSQIFQQNSSFNPQEKVSFMNRYRSYSFDDTVWFKYTPAS